MRAIATPVEGAFLIQLGPHHDSRGAFVEAFVREAWAKQGVNFDIAQINFSKSSKAGTIRGLHWQKDPHAQGKVVYSARGRIYDAIVDVRKGSPTFGASYGALLTPQVNALFVPKGLAHGFQALEDEATLVYLVDAPYVKSAECGLRYDDAKAAIAWPLDAVNVAEKDLQWPTFGEL